MGLECMGGERACMHAVGPWPMRGAEVGPNGQPKRGVASYILMTLLWLVERGSDAYKTEQHGNQTSATAQKGLMILMGMLGAICCCSHLLWLMK